MSKGPDTFLIVATSITMVVVVTSLIVAHRAAKVIFQEQPEGPEHTQRVNLAAQRVSWCAIAVNLAIMLVQVAVKNYAGVVGALAGTFMSVVALKIALRRLTKRR